MATGVIDTVDRRKPVSPDRTRVTVVVDRPETFKAGQTVEIRKVLSDEDIGKALRQMLSRGEGVGKASLRDLAEAVEDEAGWPVLADLIRDVAGI